MENITLNAYLDFELTRKLEALTINALPENTFRSDFNMLYIANVEVTEGDDGKQYQFGVECDDTFFLSIVNDFGNIDYRAIKIAHIAGIYETDFETMEYYPFPAQMHLFSNYHANKPIPKGGGYMNVAYSPFGVNKLEMLNGDIIHIYGNGRVKVKEEMIGLKGYKQIPKVNKILHKGILKILKLALYTRYNEYMRNRYYINIFSPTMRKVNEEVEGQFTLDNNDLIFYTRPGEYKTNQNGNIIAIKNLKDQSYHDASVFEGVESNINGIDKTIGVGKNSFIDLSEISSKLNDSFTIHTIATINEYSNIGTIIFDSGYGLTQSGFQTHHLTLWVDSNGELKYNAQYSDESIGTGYIVKKDMENIFTLTVENQKYDKDDKDEYVTFIHVNGKQIWPKEKMYTKTEKIYIWRAMEAYRTYNDVCMKLPAPHPVSGGLDAKSVCARKLLHESGFITLDNLLSVYELYQNRPRPSKADPTGFSFGDSENTKIKKLMFGQDSEKDLNDSNYYMNGSFSEILIFSPSLGRKQIEDLHLLNIMKIPSVKV